MRKALNKGTVPLVNQMNASKIIAITGVALHITNSGVRNAFMKGKNPLSNPSNVETDTMMRKLTAPLMSVVETCCQNRLCITMLPSASKV